MALRVAVCVAGAVARRYIPRKYNGALNSYRHASETTNPANQPNTSVTPVKPPAAAAHQSKHVVPSPAFDLSTDLDLW